jgi:Cu(I)/Ag(I) efflux system membrane protein CusA/SilA
VIEKIIEASARNKFLVLLLVGILVAWGIWALKHTPLDAIPDLSDVQVIIFTEWPGRAPQLVEDQITYPIVTTMLGAPKVKVVRGYSFFGLSFIYVIFEDGTDMYWARSRILEYMNETSKFLPEGITPTLGPDATGVGWGFEYAVVDPTGKLDLAELRTLQDWYIRYWLKAVPGVSDVASVGGYVKQYQVNVDPNAILAYNLSLDKVISAIQKSNNDVGGRVVEFTGREYMVWGRGYVESLKDLEQVAVGTDARGTPVLLRDIGRVELGPDLRRGLTELNGTGEVVGGIVVVRFGESTLDVIERVKVKLKEVAPALPEGVQIVPTYDRSDLILRSVALLKEKLIEEFLIVSFITILFLFHVRSALVAILTLPLALLMSIIAMYYLGISSNIMSLGGMIIAIGTMVDGEIVMVENAHKKLEHAEAGRDLFSPHYHRFIFSRLRFGSTGGQTVPPPRLYKNVCDGFFRDSGDYDDTHTHGPIDSGKNYERKPESSFSDTHCLLQAHSQARLSFPKNRDPSCRDWSCGHMADLYQTRFRVYAPLV